MHERNIKKLKKQRDEINARLNKERAKKRAQERKNDTRRKIILGGFLLSRISYDENAKKLYEQCLNSLEKEQDKELFEVLKND